MRACVRSHVRTRVLACEGVCRHMCVRIHVCACGRLRVRARVWARVIACACVRVRMRGRAAGSTCVRECEGVLDCLHVRVIVGARVYACWFGCAGAHAYLRASVCVRMRVRLRRKGCGRTCVRV